MAFMEAGIRGVRQYRHTTEIAIITLPMTMKGRNLPILVLVRSISAPMMGSVMASNTRMTVTMTDAYRPSSRMLEPNCAT